MRPLRGGDDGWSEAKLLEVAASKKIADRSLSLATITSHIVFQANFHVYKHAIDYAIENYKYHDCHHIRVVSPSAGTLFFGSNY